MIKKAKKTLKDSVMEILGELATEEAALAEKDNKKNDENDIHCSECGGDLIQIDDSHLVCEQCSTLFEVNNED